MQEFQEQLSLSINSELQLGHTKRGLFCSPVFACVCFQTRLSHFFPVALLMQEELFVNICKHPAPEPPLRSPALGRLQKLDKEAVWVI